MKLRRFLLPLSLSFSLLLLSSFWAYNKISSFSAPYHSSKVDEINCCKTGLLLGTSPIMSDGSPNDFFYNRINAAVELFKKGKIKYIIVSGDNSDEKYNEPERMREELLKQGIPDSVIVLDFAGLRTLDSVIRAKEIFGQDTLLMISQQFHNERAIFIARNNNIVAFGYNAVQPPAYKGLKTTFREFFARDKAFFDQWFNVKPKYLGEKVKIN